MSSLPSLRFGGAITRAALQQLAITIEKLDLDIGPTDEEAGVDADTEPCPWGPANGTDRLEWYAHRLAEIIAIGRTPLLIEQTPGTLLDERGDLTSLLERLGLTYTLFQPFATACDLGGMEQEHMPHITTKGPAAFYSGTVYTNEDWEPVMHIAIHQLDDLEDWEKRRQLALTWRFIMDFSPPKLELLD